VAGQPAPAWARDVTRDAVRHFAWGIGDNNPLWSDPQYAQQSCRGGLLAPPAFLYALHETTLAPGHDPRPRLYVGADWCWYDTLPVGKAVLPAAQPPTDHEDSSGITQTGVVAFHGGNGHLVAEVTTRCLRPSAQTAAAEYTQPRYSDDELARIEMNILAEGQRGAEPRQWQETALGDRLGPLTKGPLSIMDIVAWCAGALGIPEPHSGVSVGGVHEEIATGPQITSWCTQLLTDWAGDAGFLHRLRVDLLQQPGLGSTTTLSGTVTHLFRQANHQVAQVAISATDQSGQCVAQGDALVILPDGGEKPALPIPEPIAFAG